MKVTRLGTAVSPLDDSMVRLEAEVRREASVERVWFDVPAELGSSLCEGAEPWLVAFLPLAATTGEKLTASEPVDKTLVENARSLSRLWRSWYPELHEVEIDAPTSHKRPKSSMGASFFSGGVDSYFTLVRHMSPETSPLGYDVRELISVWGFDVPLERPDEWRRMAGQLESVAKACGKRFVPVATNLRETNFRKSDWGGLAHGCALAAVALSLGKRYAYVLIGSTHDFRKLQPWGSHPLSDPLVSTAYTKFIHDGIAYARSEKIKVLVEYPEILASLRVCWRGGRASNCWECNKCYRTMATLDVLQSQGKAKTFEWSRYNVERVGHVFSQSENDKRFIREVGEFAREHGREDIANAAVLSLRRSAFIQRGLAVTDISDRYLRRLPLLWRFAGRLRGYLLKNAII